MSIVRIVIIVSDGYEREFRLRDLKTKGFKIVQSHIARKNNLEYVLLNEDRALEKIRGVRWDDIQGRCDAEFLMSIKRLGEA